MEMLVELTCSVGMSQVGSPLPPKKVRYFRDQEKGTERWPISCFLESCLSRWKASNMFPE